MKNLSSSQICQNQIQDRFSGNTVDSIQYRISQIEESYIQKLKVQTELGYAIFKKITKQQIEQPQISSNLHRGSISWLIKVCWTKNYKYDVLWSSIAFYYVYKSSILIQKDRIVLILSTCLYLSVKLHSSQSSMTIKNILQFGDPSWKAVDIQAIQYQILALLDFQPYFQTPLTQLFNPDESLNFKMLFLTETLMFESFESMFNRPKLQQIKDLCENPLLTNSFRSKILTILKNKKQTDGLIKKYISKFNVQEFIQLLRADRPEN